MNRIGLKRNDLTDLISIAVGGGKAGVIFEGDRRFDIVVKLPEHIRQDITALEDLPLPLPSNNRHATIPLKEVANIELTEGMNEIRRENGKRVLFVQTNVRGTRYWIICRRGKR